MADRCPRWVNLRRARYEQMFSALPPLTDIYSFAFPRAARRVMPIKGATGSRPSIQVSDGKVKGRRLWLVGA